MPSTMLVQVLVMAMKHIRFILATTLIGTVAASIYAFNRGSSNIAPITTLSTPIPGYQSAPSEVVEFFHYGCGHCYEAEKKILAWQKQLPNESAFSRIPVDFKIGNFDAVTTMYALESLGRLEQLHPLLFTAIHEDKLNLGKTEVFDSWLARQGIAKADFAAAVNSQAVVAKVKRAKELQTQADINGVPAMLVSGRHVVRPTQEAKIDGMLQNVETLLKKQSIALLGQ
jgi:protein dithiol oxidoreductase (disulfide-forming)